MKKALLFFLICVTAVTFLSVTASAATYGALTYEVSGGEVTITDCSTSASGSLAIPSQINGYPVTSIGYQAFYGCSRLTSINIPESVTSIGNRAFYNCSGLTTITIPESVTSIGEYAFCDCSGLTTITIPESVTSIDNGTFSGCSGLTSITIPESVTSIESWTFASCSRLTSITIPESVTSIGNRAFYNCSGLTTITIPESVTSIGEYAFCDCSGLTSITIPESVTSIDNGTFSGCLGLTNITIPDSVTSIGFYAFYNTGYYNNSSNWENNVLYIENRLVEANTSIAGKYEVKEGTKSIVTYAFADCSGLTSITIPGSVTSIESWTFASCSGLTTITIPDSVTSIGDSAFYGCWGLTSITIPDSVTSIGDWAFYDCSGLTSITIPDSVTYIGSEAFYNCEGLTIYGYADSAAESYAKNNGINFVTLDEEVECQHTFGEWITDKEPTETSEGEKHRECSSCGAVETESIPVLDKTDIGAVFTFSSASAKPGETFKVTLSLKTYTEVNSIGLRNLEYDRDVLEFIGFGDYEAIEDMPILTAMFDDDGEFILIGFTENLIFDGDICTLEFKVKESAADKVTELSLDAIVKLNSTIIKSTVEKGEITVYTYIKGDIDGDEDVDLDDAVYLFGYTIMPEFFPMTYLGDVDFTSDGNVDIQDAIALFNYSMLPDLYPLK